MKRSTVHRWRTIDSNNWRQYQPDLLVIGFLIGLILIGYGSLTRGYFATDEWWAFSYAISHPDIKSQLATSGVHAPAANLFIAWLYRTFGLNASIWGLLTLFFHLANTVMVYGLGTKLSGSRLVGLFSAAAFTSLPMGSQFLHQFSLMPTAGIATFFAFFALILYSWRRLIPAVISFAIGLAFSPYISPFIFLFFLIEAVLFQKKQWRRSLGHYGVIATLFAGYLLLQRRTTLKSDQLHDRPISGESDLFDRLQVVGQKIYQSFGELVSNLPGTISMELVLQRSTYLFIIGLALIGLLFWYRRWQLAKTALAGLLWIPASVTLFATLNTVALDATFPGRYLYIPTVGLGLLIGSLLAAWQPTTKQNRAFNQSAIVAIIIVFLGFYLPQTRQNVLGEVKIGEMRHQIMDQIIQAVPRPLRRDALFCFTSNTGHYGVGPEQIPLPFVHNFAFNLGVVYRSNEPKLKDFFEANGFFLNPAASFYYLSGDQNDPHGIGPGIGFATSPEQCQGVIARHPTALSLEDVYGFAYDGTKARLTDITLPLQQYLAGDQSVKSQLYPW